MENKTNIYINSKNRNSAETASKFVYNLDELRGGCKIFD